MTSQDFNVGDEVIATGVQDGVEFSDTLCVVEYVDKGKTSYTLKLNFDRADTKSDLWVEASSKRMTWYVYHPQKVRVQKVIKYDPTQQPYDEDDI